MMTAFFVFMFLKNIWNRPIEIEYVSKKSNPPFMRVHPGGGHAPLRCTKDIHCPKGSRCYAPKLPLGTAGVCVVTYDMKLVKDKDHELWPSDSA